MTDNDTVRDVMKDRIRNLLEEYFKSYMIAYSGNVDADLIANIADEAFSVCGISEKEQDEEW